MKVREVSEDYMKERLAKYSGEIKKSVIFAFVNGAKTKEISKTFKIPEMDVQFIKLNYATNLINSMNLSDRYVSR